MIQIKLNGEATDLANDTHIETLLIQLNLQDQRLAVEINEQIIPRSRFTQHAIQDQDTIEIVRAIGGG